MTRFFMFLLLIPIGAAAREISVCASGCDFTSEAVARLMLAPGDRLVGPPKAATEVRFYRNVSAAIQDPRRGSLSVPAVTQDAAFLARCEGCGWFMTTADRVAVRATAAMHAGLRARHEEIP